MAEIGRFFSGQGLLMQLVYLGVALALGWVLLRPFKKLHPYTGQVLVIIGILWVGILFFFITYAFRIPRFANVVTTGATIPRFWFYVLIPVSFLAFIPMLKGEEIPDEKRGNLQRLGLVFATLVISLLLFRSIGYYISSALFLVVVMWLLDSRSKIDLIAVPVGWVIFSYFFFNRLLYVRLPIGSLISRILG